MQTKICTYCKKAKDTTDFYSKKGCKDGRMPHCKPCHNNESKAWQKKNPKKVSKNRRNYHIRITYGLSPEDFNNLLESQNNKCKICYDQLVSGFQTHIDHDHSNGKVRGLLCNSCNLAIGFLRESPIIARNLALYLESN